LALLQKLLQDVFTKQGSHFRLIFSAVFWPIHYIARKICSEEGTGVKE
jgi:hypothetical protein